MNGNGLIYSIVEGDSAITSKVINEINIKLINLINNYGLNSSEYLAEDTFAEELINTARSLDKSYDKNYINYSDIIEALSDIIKTGVLSPITLEDSEFNQKGDCVNNRVSTIFRIEQDTEGDYLYYNANAYIGCIKYGYDHNHNQEFLPAVDWTMTGKIYITKGGVITGEYINNCIINKETCANINLAIPIKLPVSVILNVINEVNTNHIYTIDSRDPMLKVLKNKYTVVTEIDKSIKGLYDIRKYVKLNK